jgi:hypothetical protein
LGTFKLGFRTNLSAGSGFGSVGIQIICLFPDCEHADMHLLGNIALKICGLKLQTAEKNYNCGYAVGELFPSCCGISILDILKKGRIPNFDIVLKFLNSCFQR